MAKYLTARVLAMAPTLLVLIFFVLLLVRLLPGNIIDIMLQESRSNQVADRAQLERRLGLDRPLPVQYLSYVGGLFRGSLGNSLWNEQQSVMGTVVKRLPVTMELTALSMLVGSICGITVGALSAVFRGTLLDYILRSLSITGLSIPNFALGTAVVVLPAIWWGWSPPVIYTPLTENVWAHFAQLLTPAVILGFGLSAGLMRLMRTQMLEVLGLDYVRTARAKGLSERSVIVRHAMRNAMIPVVTALGLQTGLLLSGSVITENIFALPGIGREMITAIGTRDYPVIQGLTVVSGIIVMVANLLVDFSYGFLDPRIRMA